jgi:hypothetical protein
MAMTPEKKVKNQVVRLLKEYGAYYFFPAKKLLPHFGFQVQRNR